MNLIDRDKLIEDLLNQDENNIYVPWAMINWFINEYVKKQPVVNQWIPCEGCKDCVHHKECERYGES